MPKFNGSPKTLKPYIALGLDLQEGDTQATADCPFCQKEGKFSIEIETGKARCWSCSTGNNGGGVNPVIFMRKLWEDSHSSTDSKDYEALARERKLAYPDTLIRWEVVRSFITGNWLIPGYNMKGELLQLYRWIKTSKGMRLLPIPDLYGHQIHGRNLYDPNKPTICLCEGPWDAMALWEVLCRSKESDNGLVASASVERSLSSQVNVLALPGCGSVGKPMKKWLPLFAGKVVYLMFDNDHPKKHPKTGRELPSAGYEAMKRAASLLSKSSTPPKEIRYMKWGEEGYDSSLPSGTDLRDELNA